jgi:hypothetical protein
MIPPIRRSLDSTDFIGASNRLFDLSFDDAIFVSPAAHFRMSFDSSPGKPRVLTSQH